MPAQQIWSSWTDGTGDNSYSTDNLVDHGTDSLVDHATIDYPQMVWGTWMEHDREQADQARYQLNQQGLQAVRQENARREAQYQQQRAQYESPEAVADRARLAQERLEKAAEETKRKETAEEVAQILLGELIGEEQLAVYKETGRLLVTGRKHDYLVHKTGGVQRVEKGKIVDLCVHVQEKILLPPTDNVIGLAMYIKADEKDFNKVANASRPAPRPKDLALAGEKVGVILPQAHEQLGRSCDVGE